MTDPKTCSAAVTRERETRHWTIPQWREAYGENWPAESARVSREADEEYDRLRRIVAWYWRTAGPYPSEIDHA